MLGIFARGLRGALALGFLPSGLKKVLGEPFTLLGPETSVGYFFDALHRAGFYYEFIGWAQLLAALLLVIPRTRTLGALLYFPIILNIWVITVAMRFQGTWAITTMMMLGALFLLCWDWDRLRGIIVPVEP